MTVNTSCSARRGWMGFGLETFPRRILAFRMPNENRTEWNMYVLKWHVPFAENIGAVLKHVRYML